MSQVLGRSAGNALEVAECVECLTAGRGDARLMAVTKALAAEMLVITGLASADDAPARVARALASGDPAERFQRMVAGLGGPADFLARWRSHLPAAPVRRAALPAQPGTVLGVDTRAVGLAVLDLGGGRKGRDDAIDPRVGLTDIAGPGEAVGPDRPLAVVHAASEEAAQAAIAALRAAYMVGEGGIEEAAVVRERIGAPAKRRTVRTKVH
jgi:thymidine phosphorylase